MILLRRPLAAFGRLSLSSLCAAILVLASPGLIQVAKADGMASLNLAAAPGQVAPFVLPAETEVERERAIGCLAQAVYFEAAFEPLAGQRAVAQVVLNRVRDANFPDSICGVVYQGWQRKTGCQFSFVCDGSLTRRPPEADQWSHAWQVALEAVSGHVETAIGTATHYHTDYVNPYWGKTLIEVGKVGQHIFYKWPGKAGGAEALTDTYAGEGSIPARAALTLAAYIG
jgi:spore germination cell wall hydrolase CwlJ-like protein